MLSLTLALSAAALPQSPLDGSSLHRTQPIKDAGVYHVATGTFERPGLAARALDADVVYANTAESLYFADFDGTVYDEGRIPGLTNPGEFLPGANREEYSITGFRFSYCDLGLTPMTASFEFAFYSSYQPCTVPTDAPDATVDVLGLPTDGCWTFEVDLSGGMEFDLIADGGAAAPGFDDDPVLDSFGWSWRPLNGSGTNAGLIIAGDPQATDPGYVNGMGPVAAATPPSAGTGTYYGPQSLCPPGASGLGTQDFFYLDNPGLNFDGCFFYGGYRGAACGDLPPDPAIYGSFFLELSSTPPIGGNIGTNFCAANANSTGLTGTLSASGSAVIGNNSVTLTAACLPTEKFGIFIQSFDAPNAGFPSGEGVLCLDPLGSFGIGRFDGPGQVKGSGLDGRVDFSTSLGEWSTDSVPTSVGVMAAMVGQTSSFQFWHRDEIDAGQAFNLTEGVSVTWE